MAKTAINIYLRTAIESGFDFIERRFDNLKELNENFHAQREWIFDKLAKKTDYKRRLAKVLEVLKMHSCKYIGISFLTENSLRAAYESRFGQSISKRSINTYIKQLREIGFISTMAAKREDGKQTANIVVIEKFGVAGKGRACPAAAAKKGKLCPKKVAHKEGENLHTKKTISSFRSTIKEFKERITSVQRLLNFVPRWFKEQISCYSKDEKEVYELWKVTKQLMRGTFDASLKASERQGVIRAAIRSFYLSAKAAARGKFRIHNPFGFFHTVLEAEGHAHIRRQAQASSSVLYNWLED